MGAVQQSVHFTSSFDGVRLAYGIAGSGHPLVRAPTWISHVEHDLQSPVMRHLVVEMASRYKLVSYDCRGVGMSQRDVSDMSLEAWLDDLEAVADAAGLQRFALWGISGAPAVAIAYAVRRPERVSRLVLCGGFCRGRLRRNASPAAVEKVRVLQELIEQGWGSEEPDLEPAPATASSMAAERRGFGAPWNDASVACAEPPRNGRCFGFLFRASSTDRRALIPPR